MKKYIILFCVCFVCIIYWWVGYNDFLYYQNFEKEYDNEKFDTLVRMNTLEKKTPENYHNLGNTWYKIFEIDSEVEDLEKAVSYYSWSLNISQNEDTQYNYDFTSELLKNIKKQKEVEQQEQAQEENNNSEGESQESNENQQWQEWEQWNEWKDSQGWEEVISDNRWEQYYINEDKTVEKLTQQEEEELKDNLEQLKLQQLHNQEFFWKQQQESDFWNIFDSFFGWINRGGKKDW